MYSLEQSSMSTKYHFTTHLRSNENKISIQNRNFNFICPPKKKLIMMSQKKCNLQLKSQSRTSMPIDHNMQVQTRRVDCFSPMFSRPIIHNSTNVMKKQRSLHRKDTESPAMMCSLPSVSVPKQLPRRRRSGSKIHSSIPLAKGEHAFYRSYKGISKVTVVDTKASSTSAGLMRFTVKLRDGSEEQTDAKHLIPVQDAMKITFRNSGVFRKRIIPRFLTISTMNISNSDDDDTVLTVDTQGESDEEDVIERRALELEDENKDDLVSRAVAIDKGGTHTSHLSIDKRALLISLLDLKYESKREDQKSATRRKETPTTTAISKRESQKFREGQDAYYRSSDGSVSKVRITSMGIDPDSPVRYTVSFQDGTSKENVHTCNLVTLMDLTSKDLCNLGRAKSQQRSSSLSTKAASNVKKVPLNDILHDHMEKGCTATKRASTSSSSTCSSTLSGNGSKVQSSYIVHDHIEKGCSSRATYTKKASLCSSNCSSTLSGATGSISGSNVMSVPTKTKDGGRSTIKYKKETLSKLEAKLSGANKKRPKRRPSKSKESTSPVEEPKDISDKFVVGDEVLYTSSQSDHSVKAVVIRLKRDTEGRRFYMLRLPQGEEKPVYGHRLKSLTHQERVPICSTGINVSCIDCGPGYNDPPLSTVVIDPRKGKVSKLSSRRRHTSKQMNKIEEKVASSSLSGGGGEEECHITNDKQLDIHTPLTMHTKLVRKSSLSRAA